MEKKFVIFWDEVAYLNGNTSKVVDLGFFTYSNGFDTPEQDAVERLDVGETTPMDNNHVWVMRVA